MAVLLEERTVEERRPVDPTRLPTPVESDSWYPPEDISFAFPGEALKGDDIPRYDETAVLFDWDDTLLSSTFLSSLNLRVDQSSPLPVNIAKELADLEAVVISILKESTKFGHVYLITNAETGWIELSAQRFLPKVLAIINSLNIRVLSARSTYEQAHPAAPCEWKIQAFVNEMLCHDAKLRSNKDRALNVICVGDSINERTAAHAIARKLRNTRIKTIKFVERPNVDQLRKQLSLLLRYFPGICQHSTSFDINLIMD
eukprot:TRINITY_DN13867_c0_g1::TRINITY_DN13867_c0_g1_i1::g.15453::m.15453 TRINITY_DN13867_c0_g1::TRINITY_DN13867_c0_g1_i1::g.15453  ORF type:complete len:295 (-),score=8.11,HAD/PF12710.2/0.083 TRINITY_DN13867_c0_g1_i1:109-882(-)